jgi:hypothetical protein
MNLVAVKTLRSRITAEAIAHTLDNWQIPFYIDCFDTGLFGWGHCHATIMVRDFDEADARSILADFLVE